MKDRGAIVLGERRARRGRWRGRLLAVVAVAAWTAWSLRFVDEGTRVEQAELDVSRIGHAARLFRADFGRCPADVAELLRPPEGAAYLERVKDPWGNEYRLTCPARFDPGGVDVVSSGPDGSFAGEDNISSR